MGGVGRSWEGVGGGGWGWEGWPCSATERYYSIRTVDGWGGEGEAAACEADRLGGDAELVGEVRPGRVGAEVGEVAVEDDLEGDQRLEHGARRDRRRRG